VQAHRFSYELHRGPIPAGMFACHRCDNPTCVNPDHIFLGTNQDNLRDAARKGRNPMQRHPEHSSFNGLRPYCKRGHRLADDNAMARADGRWRQCRICKQIASAAWYARNASRLAAARALAGEAQKEGTNG
jgi:hypothetical protein